MKKKIIAMLITLGALSGAAVAGSTTTANAEGELTIFENGNFSKEVGKHDAGSEITDGKWHNAGDGKWAASRVIFNEGIDLSNYETIVFTYSASGSDTWVEFGMGNAKLYGEFDYVTKGNSLNNDGNEHEISFSIDDFASQTSTTCTWGGTHSDASLDITSISGLCIKAGNIMVNVSKIVALPKQTITQDLSVFENGTWTDSSTHADSKVASNSILEDNMWKIRGNGTTMCRVLMDNGINIKEYKRIIVQYKNANAESAKFGIGTIKDYAYTSVHQNVSLVKNSEDINTFEVNLIDYDGTAFDQHQWATPTGNLDLSSVKGFDFVGDGLNIDIVGISASLTGGESQFDPTPVDVSMFDNTKVNENAEAHNANAYKIKYGDNNWAYVGTSDTASNLNSNIATRIVDGDNYAIKYTNANLIRYDNASAFNLKDAMLNDGWVEFDLNFEKAPSSNKFKLRLYDGSGQWGERLCVEKEMDVLSSSASYQTYRVQIKDFPKYCYASSYGAFADLSRVQLIDMSAIHGMGFTFDEDVTVQIRNLHYGYTPVNHRISGIEASTTKINYNSGDTLDSTTFKVNVLFDDNTKVENISNFVVKNIGQVSVDNKDVQVSFKNGSEQYTTNVELSINTARSLLIKTMPDKLVYNTGDKLDLTGIIVEATMSDDSKKTLTVEELQASVDIVSQGDEEVIISYAGAQTTFTITINTTGKAYDAFSSNYLVKDETSGAINPKQGYFVGGSDNNSETPTAYVDEVDGKSVFVTNQTVDWRISRFLSSDGTLNLQEISVDVEISVLITYRTSEVASGKFYLFNNVETSTWDQVYKDASISFNNDGNWHKAKISMDDLLGNTTGHLDSGNIPTGYTTISPKKISGWGLGAVGKLEISNITYVWDNEMDPKWTDTKAPEITYDGETTFNQKEGEKPHEVNATAFDSYDGNIMPTYTWSEGALDENGNLKAGTHTLTISAKDKAGNEAPIRTITYVVAVNENPDPTPTPDKDNKGLSTGAIIGIVVGAIAVVGIGVGTYFLLKTKKK